MQSIATEQFIEILLQPLKSQQLFHHLQTCACADVLMLWPNMNQKVGLLLVRAFQAVPPLSIDFQWYGPHQVFKRLKRQGGVFLDCSDERRQWNSDTSLEYGLRITAKEWKKPSIAVPAVFGIWM